ncbi:Cell wall-associated hydrolase, NlpC family [Geodermatophilus saharensis]|uniref:Cell wall-associated hydrolase, NlpC family n=1 Tax=Geodermatophilus saharensis TaxID=1137994 RepID=A0A239B934_9ACTN|nr:C40 family peptidase [Geodermatophilus saharensis]SNS03908.1 Cell wall-associated hydrolase, NlpC family [Geodermatophilus saharensis]
MQRNRTTGRRWTGAVLAATGLVALVLVPGSAAAAPSTAEEAAQLVEEAGRRLTALDEQVHQAQLAVEAQQQAATDADRTADDAEATLATYEPAIRAIAQSGYTGTTRSRVAAFLGSDSADDLIAQMTMIDLIADHTDGVLTDVAAAQARAAETRASADAAAAEATAALRTLEEQQAQVQAEVDRYEADFERLTAAEQARVTAALAGPVLAAPPAAVAAAGAPGPAAATAVETALAQLGDPYVWGSSGPDGFDCSGLTQYAYAAAGISLPHSSKAQSTMGTPVSRAELLPGDIVYFYSPVSHVGIYIGDGRMVHARTFGQPVAVTSVDQAGYRGAVRVA